MSANDPLAEMLLEAEDQANAEREERSILLQRITELRDMVAELAKAVGELSKMERAEQVGKTIRILERDESDRIKSIEIN